MEGRLLDYIALGVLIFVVLTIVYGIIYIHDIPYEIAKKRKHPHQDAIHTAGWVSLFLMHTIWPFLWIWATLYKPDLGWGFQKGESPSASPPKPAEKPDKVTAELNGRIAELERQRDEMQRTHAQHIQELSKRIFKLEQKAMKEGGE